MLSDDVKQWIQHQVGVLQYSNPHAVFADTVHALETHANLRPRTEYADFNEIWLVLHSTEPVPATVLKIPRGYPIQSPQLFVRGHRRDFGPHTSLMTALSSIDHQQPPNNALPNNAPGLPAKTPEIPSKPRPQTQGLPGTGTQKLPEKPELPEKPDIIGRPDLPPKPGNGRSGPAVPIKPPKLPESPLRPNSRIGTQSPSKYDRAPPLPPNALSTHEAPSDRATSAPASSSGPVIPVRSSSLAASYFVAARAEEEIRTASKPPPVDLMNSVSISTQVQSERTEILQELLAKLSHLPDPPAYTEIDDLSRTLDNLDEQIKHRRQAIERRKRQLLDNIEMLKKATAGADHISELVDSQLVPLQLADLVQVTDPDAALARSKSQAAQDTLNLLPRSLDAGVMGLNVYLPLVRQLAREEFHQKLRAMHKV